MKSFGCMPAVRTPEASRTLTVSCPGILPSPLRDKVGAFHHDRFRGYVSVHSRSGLHPPCLRFAAAVAGHHARLGTRLLVWLCRGRHHRRLNSMRLQGATRTDPSEPNSGTRLLPRVSDGKAYTGPGVQDTRLGEELVRQLRHLRPYQPRSLAAPAQPPMPEDDDVVAKCSNRRAIGRHGVVGEIPADDLPEPFPGFRNWPVHSSSQRFLDFPELRTHAVAARLPFDLEIAPSGLAADEHEAQELERLRFAKPALLAVLRRKAAELNQAGFV